MKKILVPIDFSEDTVNTIDAACDLARKQNCGMILLHSYYDLFFLQSINAVSSDIVPLLDPDIAFLRDSNEERMIQLEQNVKVDYPDLPVETIVTPLELKEIIGEVCEKNDILMIVMGATGTGKKESFSGSTASTLFDYAPVPVLAIPREYDWRGSKNILYATSFAEAAQAEVRFILDLFVRQTNHLYCYHLRFPDTDSLLDDAQMKILSEPFAGEIESGTVIFDIIDTDSVEDTLDRIVEENRIGLISFHEQNRSVFYQLFHKTIIKKNIYKFNIPLLVFRKY